MRRAPAAAVTATPPIKPSNRARASHPRHRCRSSARRRSHTAPIRPFTPAQRPPVKDAAIPAEGVLSTSQPPGTQSSAPGRPRRSRASTVSGPSTLGHAPSRSPPCRTSRHGPAPDRHTSRRQSQPPATPCTQAHGLVMRGNPGRNRHDGQRNARLQRPGPGDRAHKPADLAPLYPRAGATSQLSQSWQLRDPEDRAVPVTGALTQANYWRVFACKDSCSPNEDHDTQGLPAGSLVPPDGPRIRGGHWRGWRRCPRSGSGPASIWRRRRPFCRPDGWRRRRN